MMGTCNRCGRTDAPGRSEVRWTGIRLASQETRAASSITVTTLWRDVREHEVFVCEHCRSPKRRLRMTLAALAVVSLPLGFFLLKRQEVLAGVLLALGFLSALGASVSQDLFAEGAVNLRIQIQPDVDPASVWPLSEEEYHAILEHRTLPL